jgi:hypothetical protein
MFESTRTALGPPTSCVVFTKSMVASLYLQGRSDVCVWGGGGGGENEKKRESGKHKQTRK